MTDMPRIIPVGAAEFTAELGACSDCGTFSPDSAPNIVVERSASPSLQRVILCHELGHAVAWEYGIEERGEQFANAFAQFLLSIIRDNPKLVAWLRNEQIHPVIGGETT